MTKEKLRRMTKLGILVLASIFLSFLVFETGLRAMKISYPIFHSFDYERGRALVPGKEGWYRGEGEAFVRINQAGFRDTEHAFPKPMGTFRIVVLGDSYTEARQVALKDTYWKQFERHLRSCQQLPFQDVEVISLGVGGYGNAEELLTLRSAGWQYNPDLIVTTFFSGNDLLDNFPAYSSKWAW